MKRFAIAIAFLFAAGALSAVEAQAQDRWRESSVRVQFGEFRPDGDSQYWDDQEFDFSARPADYEDTAAAVSWLRPLGPRVSLQVSGFGWEGVANPAYRAFTDQNGADIVHTTEMDLTALTLGLTYNLTGPDATVIPYVGVGGGIYSWRLSEFGDFIDFGAEDLEIFDAFFEQEDEDLGWYFTAGLEVPVSDYWSVFAEGRWDNVNAELAGDFRGLGELDLSGRTYSGGLSWSF